MSDKLKETIVLTFAYYNRSQTLSDAVLLMYVEDLKDLDAEACIDAYGRFRRNPANKTFPLPAQIRELVNPEEFVSVEARAREVAGRVVGAVSMFGWCNSRDAEAYIGPEGWIVVQRQGGWSYICENMGLKLNPTTFQAQVRDQVEGSLKYGREALEKSIFALPESEVRKGSLEGAKGIMALIPNKPEEGE